MNRPAVVIPLTVLVSVLVMLGQTAVKQAINRVPGGVAGLAFVLHLIRDPVFYGGVAVGAAGTFTWMYVLARADFSYALPLLTFCGMLVAMIAAATVLHEPLDARRIAGTLLIAVGAFLVART